MLCSSTDLYFNYKKKNLILKRYELEMCNSFTLNINYLNLTYFIL